MDYKRHWRRLHTEVDALAQASDGEQEPHHFSNDESSTGEPHLPNSDQDYVVSDNDEIYHENDWMSTSSDNDTVSTSDDTNGDTADEYVDQEPVADLAEDLTEWATRHKCTRTALNELLNILRKQGHRLPKDSRTLLKTPRSINTIQKSGGDYLYLGIESGISKVIAEHPEHFRRIDQIKLSFNIDGVPLFKSSSVQLWPILCSIKNFEPFVVAVYCSNTKPNSIQEYLFDFLMELETLKQDGIIYDDDLDSLQVSISAFICDAPARSFLKCIKGHNAYYSCERCTIRGTYTEGRVVYSIENDLPAPRSEQRFNNFEYKDHQISKSPLIDAGLSCIKSFPLDYMHLVCLGIVKRVLLFLKKGPRECRLSHQQLVILSERLSSLNGKMPREFARQPRSIFYLDKWKATEFRQFLLYTGPLVLRTVVSERLYKHFLTLTVAMSILLESDDNFRNEHLEYAMELLIYFVKNSTRVYGEIFVSYNVHALIHLADDVEHYGSSLNDINAFQYENHLHKLKKNVRKAQNPIAQVVKRIVEMEKSKVRYRPKKMHMHMHISTKKKDSCFLLKNKKFAFVKEKRENKSYVCDVVSQQNVDSFFENPCDSKLLNIAVLPSTRRHFIY